MTGARDIDERYLDELRERFPRLRVIDKAQDRFSGAIDLALRIMTFGGQRHYMTRYVTTIGARIYLPSGWRECSPESRYVTLRHEAVHLAQFRRYGLVGTALIYLIPIFPLGLAWGRAKLEKEAYAETFRATAEVFGLEAAKERSLREHVIAQFTGPAYGWMWPFRASLERWVDGVLAEIDRAR